ncbi:hypothetical protein [Sphingomonas sanguinis]|uniref:hypothetical protein n=1 Tax=Sphingomonas sanguinis TaxID=33051 RepID=UPI00077BAEC3|nr:hypothetical protein [Sphingomonas sanguinis]
MRMMGLMLAGVSVLALSACATGAAEHGLAVKAGAAVDRAEQHYASVAAVADDVLPLLPKREADHLRAFRGMIEQVLLAARMATTIGERVALLRKAEAATAELEQANSVLSLPPPDPG